MFNSSDQYRRQYNVYSNDCLVQSFGNSRPSRGRPHWFSREPYHFDGMRYDDERRFPVRSRGPTSHFHRHWATDSSFEYGNNPGHPTSGSNHQYSASMNCTPQMTRSQVTHLNEKHRWQFGSHSYQVERRYTHPVYSQSSWNGDQHPQQPTTNAETASFEKQVVDQSRQGDHYKQHHGNPSWQTFQANYMQERVNAADEKHDNGVNKIDVLNSNKMEEEYIPLDASEVSSNSKVPKEEEASAQNFEDSEGQCDDSDDDDIVIIGEKFGSKRPPSSSTRRPCEVVTVELPTRSPPIPATTQYSQISSQYFYCHICFKHLDNAFSFNHHINSQHHRMMLNMLEEGNSLRIQLLRFEAKRQEQIDASEVQNRTTALHNFCNMCCINYIGDFVQHQDDSIHRKLQDILTPFCRLCMVEFGSAVEREAHRLSAEHLLAKEKADERSLAQVLEKTCVQVVNLNDGSDENANNDSHEVNNNQVDIEEPLGKSDDPPDSSKNHATRSDFTHADDNIKDHSTQQLGEKSDETVIQEVRAFFCRLCCEFFELEAQAQQTHCQSEKHLDAMQTRLVDLNESTNHTGLVCTESTAVTSSMRSLSSCSPVHFETNNSKAEPTVPQSFQFAVAKQTAAQATLSANSTAGSPISAGLDVQESVCGSQAFTAETSGTNLSTQDDKSLSMDPSSTVVKMNSTSDFANPRTSSLLPSNMEKEQIVAAAESLPPEPATASACLDATNTTAAKSTGRQLTTTSVQTDECTALSRAVDPYDELANESSELKLIVGRIRNGAKVMVALRGIPGSGKTYLANRLKGRGVVVSNDDFLTDLRGKYIRTQQNMQYAASMVLKKAFEAVQSGISPVIIDNHNLTTTDTNPLLDIAKTFRYRFYILEPTTTWKYVLAICAEKNVHGLTFEQVRQISETFLKQTEKKRKKLENKVKNIPKQTCVPSKKSKKPPAKKRKC